MKKSHFNVALLLLLLLSIPVSGCYHVALDPTFTYPIHSPIQDKSITVYIAPQTLKQEFPVRSWMTGVANRWDIQPGLMLKQIADIEIPQMFKDYHTADFYEASSQTDQSVALELSIPQYAFANFHATTTVRAIAHGSDGSLLFDKQYTEEGFGQGGKMFGAGAFGMKSAIRQSSLDAYKKIFTKLRSDLQNALHGI